MLKICCEFQGKKKKKNPSTKLEEEDLIHFFKSFQVRMFLVNHQTLSLSFCCQHFSHKEIAGQA